MAGFGNIGRNLTERALAKDIAKLSADPTNEDLADAVQSGYNTFFSKFNELPNIKGMSMEVPSLRGKPKSFFDTIFKDARIVLPSAGTPAPTRLAPPPPPPPEEPDKPVIPTPPPPVGPPIDLIEPPIGLPDEPGRGPITPDPGIDLPPEAGIGTLIGDPLKKEKSLEEFQKEIEDFGRRQEEQIRQMFQVQEQQRTQRLQDLGQFLGSEEERRFGEIQPQIEEALNTRGLLRSSALGEALASERGRLEQETQAALLGQGLSDREAAILGVEATLAPRLQSQTAGLERAFSLEDIQKEMDLARELAKLGVPVTPGARSSIFGGAVGGGLSGAASGAMIGSVVPGIGTGVGAVAGGLLGAVGGGGGGK